MGFFLRSRLVTHILVLIGGCCASFATWIYAWQFSRSWPNPTTFTKTLKVFAMVFHALFATQSLLTWHSLRLTNVSLSFGIWAMLGLASVVADSWWFGLMVWRDGFDVVCGNGDVPSDCVRRSVTIASCVYFGLYGLYRFFVLLVVFHFDVFWNEKNAAALPTSTPTPAAPSHAATGLAPTMTMAQWAAAPTPAAALTGTSAGAKLHSLAKVLRPQWPSRAHWRQLARWSPVPDTSSKLDARAQGLRNAGNAPLMTGRKRESDGEDHQRLTAQRPGARGGVDDLDEDDERGVLFDVEGHAGYDSSTQYGRTSVSSMRKMSDDDDSSDLSLSSGDDDDNDDDAAAQAAYESRRAARRLDRSMLASSTVGRRAPVEG